MDFSDNPNDMKHDPLSKSICSHCRGAEYVPAYWLEKGLQERGLHMTQIPSDVFKLIPVETLFFCHCHVLVTYIRRDEENPCLECDGTTWQFTETAELEGYRLRKVGSLSTEEVKRLPCEYFERCPCSDGDRSPKEFKRRELLKNVLELSSLKFSTPSLAL